MRKITSRITFENIVLRFMLIIKKIHYFFKNLKASRVANVFFI
jgi:hypothetical protein